MWRVERRVGLGAERLPVVEKVNKTPHPFMQSSTTKSRQPSADRVLILSHHVACEEHWRCAVPRTAFIVQLRFVDEETVPPKMLLQVGGNLQ